MPRNLKRARTRAVMARLAAVTVPLALLVAASYWIRAGVENDARARVERKASALAEHMRRILETQETVLEAALARVRGQAPETIAWDRDVHTFLAALERHAHSTSAVSVIDLDTPAILTSSARFPPPVADLRDRDYVRYFTGTDRTGTYIGEVVRGAARGRLGFTVSRKDAVRGIAAVTLVPLEPLIAFHLRQLESVRDAVTVARDDGAALALSPAVPEPVGYRVPETSVFLRYQRGEISGTQELASGMDGVDRMWSRNGVGSYPVHVLYGLDMASVRAEWQRRLAPFTMLAFVGAVLLLLAQLRAERALELQLRSEGMAERARLEAQQARCNAENEQRLRAAMGELDQIYRSTPVGLVALDRDLRYLRINERLALAHGIPAAAHVGRRVDEVLPALAPSLVPLLRRVIDKGEVIADFELAGEAPGMPGLRNWLVSYHPLRTGDGEVTGVVGAVLDITERKRAEAHIELLMREVNHRAKNLLGVVHAMVRMTSREGDMATLAERVGERIRALAASQDLLVNNSWAGIDLATLVRSQLAPLAGLADRRVELDGPALQITAAAAQAIGMAIFELATNASKYGALSNDSGTVTVRWRLDGERFAMMWREAGGPPVTEPARRGFGHTVIEAMAGAAVGGEARLDWCRDGVRWNLEAPSRTVLDGGDGSRRAPFQPCAARGGRTRTDATQRTFTACA